MAGAEVLVTGDAAESADFTSALRSAMPVVVGVVLALAFVLLVAAFRSPWLAAAVIGLNLLSVLAAYGVLVAVFQHGFAADLLGVEVTGPIVSWIPLFAFVILFGLSMDYTVVVLERIREARMAGRSAREAVAEGVGATAGAVTSAAIVMVAVFSLFAMLRLPEMKQLGVGLGAAVLIDATIVRGIALPAAVALLGERRWRVAPRRRRPRERVAREGEIIELGSEPRPIPAHDR
jgi:RND superfamily putative drug exporter